MNPIEFNEIKNLAKSMNSNNTIEIIDLSNFSQLNYIKRRCKPKAKRAYSRN